MTVAAISLVIPCVFGSPEPSPVSRESPTPRSHRPNECSQTHEILYIGWDPKRTTEGPKKPMFYLSSKSKGSAIEIILLYGSSEAK